MSSNKFVNSEKITLVVNEKIITNDKRIANNLNHFFLKLNKNLNIPQKNHTDSIIENVREPSLKAILKYRRYHIAKILAIKRKTKSGPALTFNHIRKMLLKR